MLTLSLMQATATPAWVGPTMAISLAVIALSVLGTAIVLGTSVLRLTAQRKKIAALVDSLQDDAQQTLTAARRLTEQAQDLMVLVRHEAGAFAETGRRVRRKVVRGIDRVEERLGGPGAAYHGEAGEGGGTPP